MFSEYKTLSLVRHHIRGSTVPTLVPCLQILDWQRLFEVLLPYSSHTTQPPVLYNSDVKFKHTGISA